MLEPDAGSVRRVRGNPIDVPSGPSGTARTRSPRGCVRRCRLPDVRLGTSVGRIVRGPARVQVRATSPKGAPVLVDAGAVVVAVPPALAARGIVFERALPPDGESAARSTPVWMGSVVKAVAVYARAFWREAGLAGAAVSYRGPFREVHDMSGPRGEPAALFGFAPAEALVGRSAEVADLFVEQLVGLFGEEARRPRTVRCVDWSREEWTNPSTAVAQGGFGHPSLRRLLDDRLAWASTEAADGSAGHLDVALRAGRPAASPLLQRADAAAQTRLTQ